MARFFLFFFWIVIAALGLLAFEAHRFLTTPGSPEAREFIFSVETGATFDRVARDLKEKGAISDLFRFRLLAMAQDAPGRLRAGEYLMNSGWTPMQVLDQLTRGRSVLYRLSLREGLTWWETARAVEEQGFATYEDFKAVIHDPEFLREHAIPFANAEGFLFPETYLLKKPRQPLDKDQAREVAAILVEMFWKKNEYLWKALPGRAPDRAAGQSGAIAAPGRQNPAAANGNAAAAGAGTTGAAAANPARSAAANNAPAAPDAGSAAVSPAPARSAAANASNSAAASPARSAANATIPGAPQGLLTSPAEIDPAALKRLLVLASLVEKETGVPAERGLVAGVYANRLRIGMLLQCDPTIIYGIGEAFSGAIRRSQIDDPKNLYNTYQHPGLPPGPICSPGLEAMKAAANPARHDFLYFVATGQGGGHTFSKTLNEHNRAVQVYRQRMRGQ